MTTNILTEAIFIGINNFLVIPLRFRKAGRVWCGSARETRECTEPCHRME